MKFSGAKYYLQKSYLNKGVVIMTERVEHFLFVPREDSEFGSILFLSKTVEKAPCNLKLGL